MGLRDRICKQAMARAPRTTELTRDLCSKQPGASNRSVGGNGPDSSALGHLLVFPPTRNQLEEAGYAPLINHTEPTSC